VEPSTFTQNDSPVSILWTNRFRIPGPYYTVRKPSATVQFKLNFGLKNLTLGSDRDWKKTLGFGRGQRHDFGLGHRFGRFNIPISVSHNKHPSYESELMIDLTYLNSP